MLGVWVLVRQKSYLFLKISLYLSLLPSNFTIYNLYRSGPDGGSKFYSKHTRLMYVRLLSMGTVTWFWRFHPNSTTKWHMLLRPAGIAKAALHLIIVEMFNLVLTRTEMLIIYVWDRSAAGNFITWNESNVKGFKVCKHPLSLVIQSTSVQVVCLGLT
jgi:hypothetical protein